MLSSTTPTPHPNTDPRLVALGAALFPDAPPFERDAFWTWLRERFSTLSDGEQELARLLADLGHQDTLLEDIGQFAFTDLVHYANVGTLQPHQAAAFRAYTQEPWC